MPPAWSKPPDARLIDATLTQVVTETDLTLADGRTLHFYDTKSGDLPVFWLHGTPQVGSPPEPLADHPRVRWLGYDRPGYGGSTSRTGRDVASAAADVAAIADSLDLDTFAVMGASGGGPHALACGALLPGRVRALIDIAGLAPYAAEGLDWFAGMGQFGAAELKAAVDGHAAMAAHLAFVRDFDPELFTAADHEALAGDWGWLGASAGKAMDSGPGPLIDDDLAYVAPWGFTIDEVKVPVLILQGDQDRVVPCAHSQWLAEHCATAELRSYPDDGHISVLRHSPAALDWLTARVS